MIYLFQCHLIINGPLLIYHLENRGYLFKKLKLYYSMRCRSRNQMSGRGNVQTNMTQPQFVQVEVADVDNQHFIVYAD